jgi:TP901 family phage tail tape measure protein
MSRGGGTSLTGAKVQVVIGSDSSEARADMRSFGQSIQDWGRRAAVAGSLLTITLTGPIAMMARTMIGASMEYEQSMNILQATTRASAEEMERMGENAKALGADLHLPGVEASNAADAMLQLAKAGMDTNEVIDASRGVIELAIAAQMDYATAAEVVATTIKTFGLEAEEASRIADLLAAGAIRSATEVGDLSQAMVMAAGTFADVNIPVEHLVGSLALLADRGLKGSMAGTGLNRAILDLVSPTDQAASLMEELGIQVFDATGTFRAFPDILEDFEDATRGMTDAQRTNALTTIFQDRAYRAMVRMIDGGVDEFWEYADAVTQGGEAGELAAAQMKGLGGAIELLRSQWASVMLELGEPFLEPLANAIRSIASFIPRLLDIPTPFLKAAGAIAAVLALLGPVLLLFSVGALAIGLLAGAAGKVALVLGGVGVALALSDTLLQSVIGSVRTFVDALRGIWVPQDELDGMNSGLDRADKHMESFGRTVGPVTNAIGRFGLVMRTFVIDSIRLVRDSVVSFRQALAGEWVDSDEILALHRIWGGLGLIVREVALVVQGFSDSFRDFTNADSILARVWKTFASFASDAHSVWVVLTALLGVFIAVKFAALAIVAPFALLATYLFGTREQVEALNAAKEKMASRAGVLVGHIKTMIQSWAQAAGVGAALSAATSGIALVFASLFAPMGRLGTGTLWLVESLGRLWKAFRAGSLASTALYQWFANIGRSTSLLAPSLHFLHQSFLLVSGSLSYLTNLFLIAIPGITQFSNRFAAIPGIVARVGAGFNMFMLALFSMFSRFRELNVVVRNFGQTLVAVGRSAAQSGTFFRSIITMAGPLGAVIHGVAYALIGLGATMTRVANIVIAGNSRMWQATNKYLSPIRSWLLRMAHSWAAFSATVRTFATNAVTAFGSIARSIMPVLTIGGRLTPWLSSIGNFASQAIGLLIRLGASFSGLTGYLGPAAKLLFTFGRPILMLLGPVGILIGLISAVVGLFMTDWRAIGGHFMPVVDTIRDGLGTLRDLFGEVFGGLKDTFDEDGLAGVISELPAALGTLASGLAGFGLDILTSIFQDVDYAAIGGILLDGLIDGIEATLDTMQRVVDFLTEWFASVDWSGVGESIAGALNSAITTAWDAVTTVHERIFDSVSEGIEGIDFSGLASEIASSAGDLFGGMWDHLTAPETDGLLADAAKSIEGPMSSVGNLITGTIVPALSSFWDIVSSRLMPTWDILKQSFSDTVQVLRDNLGPSFETLSTGFSAIMPVIGTVAAILGGILLVALNTVVRVLAVMLPHALSAVFGLFNAAVGIITLAANNIMTVFMGLVDFVKAVFAGEWREAFGALLGIVTGIFDNMVDAIPGILSGLWQAIKGIIVGLVEGVIQLFVGLYESLVGNSIIPDMVEAIVEWIASLPGRVMEWITELVTTVIEAISGFVADVLEWFSELASSVIESVSGFVSDVIEFWSELISTVIENVSQFVSDVIEFWTELISTVVENVSGFVTDIIEFYSDLYTGVTEKVSEIVTDVVEFFVQLATDVVETVEGFITDILEAIAQFAIDMYEGAKEVITQAIAGVTELAGDLVDAFKKPIEDILTWLGNQVERFKNAAGSLISGFISGITGGAGDIFRAGMDAGGEALSGLKFWEGSPWPEAIKIGGNAVLGLVIGMEEKEQEAFEKAVSIASGVVDLFEKTMNFMDVAFSFNVSDPPTHVLKPISKFIKAAIDEFKSMGLAFSEEAKENLDVVTDSVNKVISAFSAAFDLVKGLSDIDFRIHRHNFLGAISELKFIAEHAVESLGWTAKHLEIGLSAGAARIGEVLQSAFGGLAAVLSFVKDLSEMKFTPSRDLFGAVSFLKFLGEHAVESLGWTARQFDRNFVNDASAIGNAFTEAFGGLSEMLSFIGQYRELDPRVFGRELFKAVSYLKFLGEHAVESLGWTAEKFDKRFVLRAQHISEAITDAFGGLSSALGFVAELLEVVRFRSHDTRGFFDAVSFLKFLAEHAVESLGWTAHQFDSKVHPMVQELSESIIATFGGLNEALGFVTRVIEFDRDLTDGRMYGMVMAVGNFLIELGTRLMVQMHRVAAHFESAVFERATEVGETMSAVFGPMIQAVDFITRSIKLVRSGHITKVTRQFIDHLINIGLYIMQNFYQASQRIGHDALSASLSFSESFEPLFRSVDQVLDSLSSMKEINNLSAFMRDVFLVAVQDIMDTIRIIAETAKAGESDAERFRDSMQRIAQIMSGVDIPDGMAASFSMNSNGAMSGSVSGGSIGSEGGGETINIKVTLSSGAVQINGADTSNLSDEIGDEIVERVVDQLLKSVATGPTIARRSLPGAN